SWPAIVSVAPKKSFQISTAVLHLRTGKPRQLRDGAQWRMPRSALSLAAGGCGRGPDHPTGVGRLACCLPSGLSPSVLEFHQVNRPLAAAGSRTITAGSELHRPRSTSI